MTVEMSLTLMSNIFTKIKRMMRHNSFRTPDSSTTDFLLEVEAVVVDVLQAGHKITINFTEAGELTTNNLKWTMANMKITKMRRARWMIFSAVLILMRKRSETS
jgi:ribulose bisphosphate carboxylase small subunit